MDPVHDAAPDCSAEGLSDELRAQLDGLPGPGEVQPVGDATGEEAAAAWPPRVVDPPKLPFAPEEDLELAIEEEDDVPAEPEFSPSRLPQNRPTVSGGAPKSQLVVFDPKNPSGRTYGDTVLRPIDEDRVRLVRNRRLDAARVGASVTVSTLFCLGSGPPLFYLAAAALGAIAGFAANESSDSTWSWSPALMFVGLAMGAFQGTLAMMLMSSAMAGVGWYVGLYREIDLR